MTLLAGVLFDIARLLVGPADLTTLVMAAAFVAVAVLAAHAASTSRTAAALPMLGRVATLREKSWRVPGRAGALRQRDPDAAGHARPRAPSAVPCYSVNRAAASC